MGGATCEKTGKNLLFVSQMRFVRDDELVVLCLGWELWFAFRYDYHFSTNRMQSTASKLMGTD